jgi:hypothetical protein
LTAPASLSSGTAVYNGTGHSVNLGALSPGKSYSFSVWTRDTSGNLSGPRKTMLHGTYIGIANPKPVYYKRLFTVAARVTNKDTLKGVAGATVRFYLRDPGSSSWSYVGSNTTASNGVVSFSMRIARKKVFKAVYVGGAGHIGVTSVGGTLYVSPILSGSYYGSVPVGGTEVVKGHVAPNLAGTGSTCSATSTTRGRTTCPRR